MTTGMQQERAIARRIQMPGVDSDRRQRPSGEFWTNRDIRLLTEMWIRYVPCSEIGKVVGRSPCAVAVKAVRLGLSARSSRQMKVNSWPESRSRLRKCLNCRKLFYSEGIGNRICRICKLGDDWKASPACALRICNSHKG